MRLKPIPLASSLLRLYDYLVASMAKWRAPSGRAKKGRVRVGAGRVFTAKDLVGVAVGLVVNSKSHRGVFIEPPLGAELQLKALSKNMVTQGDLIRSLGLNGYGKLIATALFALTCQGHLFGYKSNTWRFARTPLGDELVEKKLLSVDNPFESFFALFVTSFYYPSKTSLLYLTMLDSSSSDPETLGKTLRSRVFSGQLEPLRRIAVETHEELYDTLYLAKLASPRLAARWRREGKPPIYVAYRLAEMFNQLIDRDSFLLTYVYLTRESKGPSFMNIDGLKHLFRDVSLDEAKLEEVWKKPYGQSLRRVLDKLASTYSETFREQTRLYTYLV